MSTPGDAAAVARIPGGFRSNRPDSAGKPEIPQRTCDAEPHWQSSSRLLNAATPVKSLPTSLRTALESP